MFVGGGGGEGGVVAVHDKPPVTDEKRFKGLLKASSTKTLGPGKAPPTVLETLEEEEKARAKVQSVLQIMIKYQPFAMDNILFDGVVTEVQTGQALVFKGTLNGSSNKVAIKMFLSRSSAEYDQEVAIMRAIPPHENVVSLLYAKDASPRRIAVMPLLEGGSLESYYEHTAGVIPPLVMKHYLKQVSLGLAHMHSSKVAHLDLKCGNVLLEPSSSSEASVGHRALVCDFGMAVQFNGKAKVVYKGTPPFMAPEVLTESEDCDLTKVDVYAFGMMIYELFVGDKPWMRLFDYSAPDPSKKWRDDIKAQVLAAKRPEVDRRWDKSLVDLMTSCWDQNPSARPSARQIYVRLLSEDDLEHLFEVEVALDRLKVESRERDESSAKTIKALESEREISIAKSKALEAELDILKSR